MKHLCHLLFWALLMGSPSLLLGQQSNSRAGQVKDARRLEGKESKRDLEPSQAEGEDDKDDEDDSAYSLVAASNGGNGRRPDVRIRSKNMVSTDTNEAEAVNASEAFARDFGITDPKDRDELLKACRKYYRAKELLDAQFTDRNSETYRKKAEILEREYSRELRRVLPES